MFIKRKEIPSPQELKKDMPISDELIKTKEARDEEIKNVLTGKDDRFILIIGPCSADNSEAVLDYISRLAGVYKNVNDKLLIIPRVYTNKPRTSGMGYKGMLHQPSPEKDSDIYAGMVAIRNLHIDVLRETGLSTADEMLYPENVPFLDDLISYHAIGARSVENQQSRLTASGIDAPVGMKNPTSGDFSVMLNAIVAAQNKHVFLYRQEEVETTANPLAHAILRGSVNKHGESNANYHYEDLMRAIEMYKAFDLENPAIIVDVNHSNSNKQFDQQPRIAKEILNSRRYEPEIKAMVKGLMIESYIEEGARSIEDYKYGQSITDACLGWEATEQLIYTIADRV